jgi:hypothetical protein
MERPSCLLCYQATGQLVTLQAADQLQTLSFLKNDNKMQIEAAKMAKVCTNCQTKINLMHDEGLDA